MKLGKDEPTPSRDDSSNTVKKATEVTIPPAQAEQKGKKPEPERKIIRFDTAEKPTANPVENKPATTKVAPDKPPGESADAAREELEQRRTILQNMKDFDFQIKKNQEDITSVSNKVENLSKDLDDLVSLYEIVSEQMNPFVGLSKVTKKRLDALENIIQEIDGVKTKLSDLEAMVEKTSINAGKKTQLSSSIPASAETKNQPLAPLPQKTSIDIQPEQVAVSQHTVIQQTDRELDDILNKSLDSIRVEQNIDTVINEFFITLK